MKYKIDKKINKKVKEVKTLRVIINELLPAKSLLKDKGFYQLSYKTLIHFIGQKKDLQQAKEAWIYIDIIELVGLMMIRFSPYWSFSLLKEMEGGRNIYFESLKKELIAAKLMPENASIESSKVLISLIYKDIKTRPRFIKTGVKNTRLLKKCLKELDDIPMDADNCESLNILVENIWAQMNKLSDQECISLNVLTGLMTIDALRFYNDKVKLSQKGFSKINYDLLDAYILRSYSETLNELQKLGLATYMTRYWK